MPEIHHLETFPPPPRQIRRRRDISQFGFNIFRLFMLPFLLVGLSLIASTIFYLLLSRLGPTVKGTVDAVDTRIDSDNNSATYTAAYHYQTRSGPQNGHAQISDEAARNCRPGSTIPLRRFAMAGLDITVLDPSEHSPMVWGLPGFALAWNAFILPIAWFLSIRPIRIRRLLATGEAVTGKIVHVPRNEGMLHIRYQFTPRGSPPIIAKAWVHDSVPFTYDVGTPITVVYDPSRPSRSVPYETSDWEVEPGGMLL